MGPFRSGGERRCSRRAASTDPAPGAVRGAWALLDLPDRGDLGPRELPTPGRTERAMLERISAPPNVRLGCQLRPKSDIAVQILLPILPSGGRLIAKRRGLSLGRRARGHRAVRRYPRLQHAYPQAAALRPRAAPQPLHPRDDAGRRGAWRPRRCLRRRRPDGDLRAQRDDGVRRQGGGPVGAGDDEGDDSPSTRSSAPPCRSRCGSASASIRGRRWWRRSATPSTAS